MAHRSDERVARTREERCGVGRGRDAGGVNERGARCASDFGAKRRARRRVRFVDAPTSGDGEPVLGPTRDGTQPTRAPHGASRLGQSGASRARPTDRAQRALARWRRARRTSRGRTLRQRSRSRSPRGRGPGAERRRLAARAARRSDARAEPSSAHAEPRRAPLEPLPISTNAPRHGHEARRVGD